LQAGYVALEDMLREVDFLMLTAPYSAATHHMIGAEQLKSMKPTAVSVNLGRRGVVDDAALVDELRSHTIFAAGLDVYEGEPALHRGLYEVENVVLTPHIASATRATRIRMSMTAANNLVAALAGKRPPNLVNAEVWGKRRR